MNCAYCIHHVSCGLRERLDPQSPLEDKLLRRILYKYFYIDGQNVHEYCKLFNTVNE